MSSLGETWRWMDYQVPHEPKFWWMCSCHKFRYNRLHRLWSHISQCIKVQQLSSFNSNRSCYSNLTQVSAVLKSNLGFMWVLQCSQHDQYLCRGTELNGKCGSSTMFAELPESPLPRDTVANANWTWVWHLWKPPQSLTFGQECRVEGRCGPYTDLLQSSTLVAEMGCLLVPSQATPYDHFLTCHPNWAKVTWLRLQNRQPLFLKKKLPFGGSGNA